jgi:hypothetical protein
VTARDHFALTAPVKLLERIATGGIQQPITPDDAAGFHRDKRLRYQTGKAINYLRRRQSGFRQNRDCRFKAEDASKEREATEDDALGLGQQCVTPIECRLQSLVPWQSRPPTQGEQREPTV